MIGVPPFAAAPGPYGVPGMCYQPPLGQTRSYIPPPQQPLPMPPPLATLSYQPMMQPPPVQAWPSMQAMHPGQHFGMLPGQHPQGFQPMQHPVGVHPMAPPQIGPPGVPPPLTATVQSLSPGLVPQGGQQMMQTVVHHEGGQQMMQTVVHQPVFAGLQPQVCFNYRVGDRVRMKGISQGAPYFGKVFIVESIDGQQARLRLDGATTVMIVPASCVEAALGEAVDQTAAHQQAVGPTPTWLAQDATADAQTQRPVTDAVGNVLMPGDYVQLRSRSQYDGKLFFVESTDVGDGRVRVCLQLSETAVSRMALEAAFLERVAVDGVGAEMCSAAPASAPGGACAAAA